MMPTLNMPTTISCWSAAPVDAALITSTTPVLGVAAESGPRQTAALRFSSSTTATIRAHPNHHRRTVSQERLFTMSPDRVSPIFPTVQTRCVRAVIRLLKESCLSFDHGERCEDELTRYCERTEHARCAIPQAFPRQNFRCHLARCRRKANLDVVKIKPASSRASIALVERLLGTKRQSRIDSAIAVGHCVQTLMLGVG